MLRLTYNDNEENDVKIILSPIPINQGIDLSDIWKRMTENDEELEWWNHRDVDHPCGCVSDGTIACFENYSKLGGHLSSYATDDENFIRSLPSRGWEHSGIKNIIDTYFKYSELMDHGIIAMLEILIAIKIINKKNEINNREPDKFKSVHKYMKERFNLDYNEVETVLAYLDNQQYIEHASSLSYQWVSETGELFISNADYFQYNMSIEPMIEKRLAFDDYKCHSFIQWYMYHLDRTVNINLINLPLVADDVFKYCSFHCTDVKFDEIEKSVLFSNILNALDKESKTNESELNEFEVNVCIGPDAFPTDLKVIYNCRFFELNGQRFVAIIFVNGSLVPYDQIKERRLIKLF